MVQEGWDGEPGEVGFGCKSHARSGDWSVQPWDRKQEGRGSRAVTIQLIARRVDFRSSEYYPLALQSSQTATRQYVL